MVPILEKEDFKRAILRRLVYSVGKHFEHAVPRDWCVAVILAVRDRLMDRWMTTTQRTYETDAKRVYYLSMEFLIGRLLEDSLSNLGITEICRDALADLDIDLDELVSVNTRFNYIFRQRATIWQLISYTGLAQSSDDDRRLGY